MPQGRKKLHAEREEHFRLVQQGYSSAEAAKRVGVHVRTARGWRNGRLLNSGRIEPPVRSQRRKTLGWETPAERLSELLAA
ncbi:hypothetical protein [Streptomyces sp. 3214.6]|uniref:hypothetical protein n=1 Tax=Streptomyces sp. 3214.6 TaxID=1882757 RepID=UPI0009A5BBD6|nr:hypothetical protein [Streptomyces sp. 3214.6]